VQLAVHPVDREIDMGALRGRRLYRGDMAALRFPATRVRGRGHGGGRRDERRERDVEAPGYVAQRHAVLRAARPREARLDGREVQGQRVRIHRLGRGRRVEQALLLHVGFDELQLLLGPPGELEVAKRLLVDGENPHRGPVLRCHVADGRAVRDRQRADARAEELHELPDHALLSEHLGHGEHEVRGGRALGELARQPESDDLGDQHRDGLAQQRRLGLDPPDTPAEDAQTVDHRGVRVGTDQRVGVRLGRRTLGRVHHAGEVLEIDLVHDARVGRHDPESLKRLLRPAQ